MNALLSVMGLYIADNTLFDNMKIPRQLDKEVLKNLLLADLAELNTIYSDPDVMKFMITNWSKSRQDIWQHWADTKDYKYNPIWNKDGTIRETEKSTAASKTGGVNLTDRSAYDSSTYQPVDKSTANADTSANAEVIREREEHGNIGVVTTQSMIQEERDIADFDLYRIIIEEFKNRFCIMVY